MYARVIAGRRHNGKATVNIVILERALVAVVLLLGVGAASAGVPEQSQEQQAPNPQPEAQLHFSLNTGLEHQFESDLDGAGELDVSRLRFGLGAKFAPQADFDVAIQFNYAFDDYSFSGNTSLGGPDPWEDIHTYGIRATVSYKATNQWTVFGGPVFQFSHESDGDIGDGFTGGGFVGASYVFSRELVLGGGLGVVSQIEDDARVFPVLVVHWQIRDHLRLTSQTAGSGSGIAGLELVYDWGDGWEAAFGGSYSFHRFQLDDGGVAPDGVGEETGIPLHLRVSRRFGEDLNLDLYGGITLGGELELEDRGGRGIASDDYDAAPFIGLALRLRF